MSVFKINFLLKFFLEWLWHFRKLLIDGFIKGDQVGSGDLLSTYRFLGKKLFLQEGLDSLEHPL